MNPRSEALYRDRCPICRGPLIERLEDFGTELYRLRCGNCGQHRFTRHACVNMDRFNGDDEERAAIAHAVRKRPDDDLITADQIEQMRKVVGLPSAIQRLDNLIVHFAQCGGPGTSLVTTPKYLTAVIGAVTSEQAEWVVRQAFQAGFLSNAAPGRTGDAELTIAGWQKYDDLMRLGAGSKHAFMAMAFSAEAKTFHANHLAPAVRQTGFELRTTDHPEKTAGSIDNRMRVEIRTARFLVCDLSDNNRGAYWEAGFAEGLGRPVIYVCDRATMKHSDESQRPHFDVARHLIIPFDREDPRSGLAELKATIRATMPDLAVMEDPTESAAS